MNDSSYVGMFVFDLADWTVLAGSDSQHPQDLKTLGGMVKRDNTGNPVETLLHAVRREVSEEGQTDAEGDLIFVEPIGNNHTRYFFLATKIISTLKKGSVWEVEEKDAEGKVVEKITARWVPFAEFVQRLYSKQYPSFGAALARLAVLNPKLLYSKKFCELMEKFPEPKNLGIDGVKVD